MISREKLTQNLNSEKNNIIYSWTILFWSNMYSNTWVTSSFISITLFHENTKADYKKIGNIPEYKVHQTIFAAEKKSNSFVNLLEAYLVSGLLPSVYTRLWGFCSSGWWCWFLWEGLILLTDSVWWRTLKALPYPSVSGWYEQLSGLQQRSFASGR